MGLFLFLLLVVVPAGLLIWPYFYLYLPYRRLPEVRWHDNVFGLYSQATSVLANEQRELDRIDTEHQLEANTLRERSFGRLLHSISVRALDGFPGIGRVTLDRLQAAGYQNVTDLLGRTPAVSGIGEKRLSDLRFAVQRIVSDAQSRFEAGACEEAQSLTALLSAMADAYTERKCKFEARCAAAKELVKDLKDRVTAAQGISLYRYLTDQILVPEKIFREPLPDIQQVIGRAEEGAVKNFRDQRIRLAEHPGVETMHSQINSEVTPVPREIVPESRIQMVKVAPAATGMVNEKVNQPATAKHQRRDLFREELEKEPAKNRIEADVVLDSSQRSTQQESEKQVAIMELTIQLAYAAARADGRLERSEKQFIDDHLRSLFGDHSSLYNQARALSGHYASAAIDVGACVRRIADIFDLEQRSMLVDVAARIVETSGEVTRREFEFLEKVSRRLGVSVPRLSITVEAKSEPSGSAVTNSATPVVPQIPNAKTAGSKSTQSLSNPALSRNECFAILEIDAAAPLSADLVRRQFNLFRERFDPDKFDTMGEEFVKVAANRVSALEEAAKTLLEEWGQELKPVEVTVVSTDLRHNPDLDAVFGA